MKKLFVLLMFSLLICVCGCATLSVSKEGHTIITNATYDQVFEYSTKTLIEQGYSIKFSDKESGIIYAEGTGSVGFISGQHHNPPEINIQITKRENNLVAVDIKAIVKGQAVDWGATETIINNIMDEYNKNYQTQK